MYVNIKYVWQSNFSVQNFISIYRAQSWPRRNNESHCIGRSPLEHEKLMTLAM